MDAKSGGRGAPLRGSQITPSDPHFKGARSSMKTGPPQMLFSEFTSWWFRYAVAIAYHHGSAMQSHAHPAS